MALTKVTDEMTSGFGTIAAQDSSAVAITGGSISGASIASSSATITGGTLTGVSVSASSDTMEVSAGVGITGAAEVFKTSQSRCGDIIQTKILIDLTGLNSGGTAGDIIGDDGTGAAYIARVTSSGTGTVFSIRMTCIETPAGGDADIDIYSATEGTGVEDEPITSLSETQIINSGSLSAGSIVYGTSISADQYLYLVGQGTSDATYTAGRFVIELDGYV
jgi:hypothetical protein